MSTRPRILLADDHPGVLKALERVLSLECDVVGVATDGSGAVEAAARLQPVVPVVDVNLPDMSGLDVCRQILQMNPRAKVILISAMSDDQIRIDALAAGASGFVAKAMAGNELVEAIRRAWADGSVVTAPSLPGPLRREDGAPGSDESGRASSDADDYQRGSRR